MRPISILATFSKLFEKAVIEYLNEDSIIPEHQSGFRKNYNTQITFLKIINDVASHNDKNPSVYYIIVLLDQSKAKLFLKCYLVN